MLRSRRSHSHRFCKKAALKDFAKLIRQWCAGVSFEIAYLQTAILLGKRLLLRYFSPSFVKLKERPLSDARTRIAKNWIHTDVLIIGCGVFVDLQKAFDTVDDKKLLAKLNHYGIRGVSNDWFKSFLSNPNQYVSISGCESGLAALNCSVT